MYELMLKVLKRCEENVETPIVAFFQNGFIRVPYLLSLG